MLICIIASSIILYTNSDKKQSYRFHSRVFSTASGWGYEILVNDSLFIHQDFIPSLAVQNGFEKKDQAEKTARLIINKLKAGHRPTVSTLEIQNILQQK